MASAGEKAMGIAGMKAKSSSMKSNPPKGGYSARKAVMDRPNPQKQKAAYDYAGKKHP